MSYKFRVLTVFAVLFLFVIGSIFAQTPRELRPGTSFSGTLREGDEQWFSVRSPGVGLIIVETTGDLDTYLEAYDASRNFIDSDDDGGEDYNARLEIFGDNGKNYLFKLRGYDEDESGPYRISAAFEQLPADRELRLGTWVSDNLGSGERKWFSVQSTGNGVVTVETTGELDTFLTAYDSSRNFIDSDDDSGHDLNARLEIFVEAGKKYFFMLRGYDRDDIGPYRILASFEAVAADTERNTERSRAIQIKLGEPIPVFFRSPSESRWYRYDVPRSGALLSIQTRGSLDTIIVLHDSRGNIITEDDDSGDDYNAMILERLNSGTVYIEVKQYGGRIGRCTLHAEIR